MECEKVTVHFSSDEELFKKLFSDCKNLYKGDCVASALAATITYRLREYYKL